MSSFASLKSLAIAMTLKFVKTFLLSLGKSCVKGTLSLSLLNGFILLHMKQYLNALTSKEIETPQLGITQDFLPSNAMGTDCWLQVK